MIRNLLFFLFVLLLMLDTLELNLSIAPGLSAKNAFLYLIFASIAVDSALKRNRKLEMLSVIFPYGICILYATFSWLVMILVIQNPRYSVFGTLISLKGGLADHLLVFIVFFYGILNARDALWLLKMIIWVVLAVNVISVVDYLNVPNLDIVYELGDGRLRGPIGEPNQYASYLVLFLPAALALAIIESGAKRLFALLGFAISALAIIMTASRGGMVGLAVGSLITVIFMRRFVSGRSIAYCIVGLVLFCAVAVPILYFSGAGDATYGRLIGQTSSGNVFDASSGRSMLWTVALGEMLDRPHTLIIGTGWSSYAELGSFRMSPHNTYLKIFYELGLIGISLVLLTFVNICRFIRDRMGIAGSDESAMLFATVMGLIAFLTAIFFVDIATPWLFAWTLVGVSVRLATMQKKDGYDVLLTQSKPNRSQRNHGISEGA